MKFYNKLLSFLKSLSSGIDSEFIKQTIRFVIIITIVIIIALLYVKHYNSLYSLH